jgi:LuxR family maltose regulon positive regulatory protein
MPTGDILETKLFIPPNRPQLISRPSLIELLDESLHRKLGLVSAPAGFGKTTLVSEWLTSLRTNPSRNDHEINTAAWLSLDHADNDVARFLTYIIAALRRADGIGADIGEAALGMLHSPQPPPSEDILTSLINDIAAIPGTVVLVLDDYHLIESQPVHDALTYLLEHSPSQLHLVIATREDPQLPLARLRALGQLNELRAADLRFTTAEAAEFLNGVMGLSLSPEEITALETRTEGWIAGLQLAAISMQGHEDTAQLIGSFTGSHRFVLDYLMEEVLEQQPESIQSFLLDTSVLDRLMGSLCSELTGEDNGQPTLEYLEQANLFIVPLDDERRWYRYHHLFHDLLAQRLYQTHPEQIPELHRRASAWYEQNGFADEAIEHSLRAHDLARAAGLIEGCIDTLWGRGEHRKLQRWLDGLPDETLLSRPYLGIFQARFQCNRGQFDAAERTLHAAEMALNSSSDRAQEIELQISLTPSDRVKLQGRAAATRAVLCSFQGDVNGIIQNANRALVSLPREDLTWRGVAAVVLGNAHGFKGDMRAAYEARCEALKACEAAGEVYFVILASLEVAITLRAQGRLQRTIEICQGQMRVASENGLAQTRIAGWLLAVWGEALAELGDLDGALDRAQRGFRLTERSGDLQMAGWSFMCLMRILLSRGDLATAGETIQRMETLARDAQLPPWVANQMAAWQARLWIAEGNVGAASGWVQDRGLGSGREPKPVQEIGYFLLSDYVLSARTLIARGRSDEAIKLLQHLRTAAKAGGRISKAIEIEILQALAYQAGGDEDRTVSALGRALALAEPEGFIRIFVDEGRPMARLLHEALRCGIAPEYVRRLLTAFSADGAKQPETAEYRANPSGLIEPLSERECEVLGLIAEGLTNREIAARLYLSLNTVKVHTRNIYGKLGVNNRTQATARARDLGVMPTA